MDTPRGRGRRRDRGVIHTSWGFKHLSAQVFYFKEKRWLDENIQLFSFVWIWRLFWEQSRHYFNSGDVRSVIGIAISQEYLVAAVKDVNSLDTKMYVSTNGQPWARAFLPFNNRDQWEIAYTLIKSSSANHLIIGVYSSGSSNTGHLFISNSNGIYFVNRLNHTNRNNEGLVEFEYSLSVDGILLANIMSNYE